MQWYTDIQYNRKCRRVSRISPSKYTKRWGKLMFMMRCRSLSLSASRCATASRAVRSSWLGPGLDILSITSLSEPNSAVNKTLCLNDWSCAIYWFLEQVESRKTFRTSIHYQYQSFFTKYSSGTLEEWHQTDLFYVLCSLLMVGNWWVDTKQFDPNSPIELRHLLLSPSFFKCKTTHSLLNYTNSSYCALPWSLSRILALDLLG